MKKILLGLVLLFCFAVPYAAQAQIVVVTHPRHHHHHYRHHHPVSPSSYLRIPLSHPCRYGFREQKRKEWGPRICNECNTCRMLTTQVGSMN